MNKFVPWATNNGIVHLETFDKSVVYNKNNEGPNKSLEDTTINFFQLKRYFIISYILLSVWENTS